MLIDSRKVYLKTILFNNILHVYIFTYIYINFEFIAHSSLSNQRRFFTNLTLHKSNVWLM